MPSPFPGMNPYLEQEEVWHDFHESFMPTVREVLAAQVGSHYIIKIDEHVYIHELSADERHFLGRAAVSVAHAASAGQAPSALATLKAPVEVQVPAVDMEGLAYVEIRDRRDRQLVTVIELLSPSNKRQGSDRDQYITRRRQLLASSAHFVELDLLRGGERMPFGNVPACDYYALVSRVEDRPRAGLWPIRLRERLPEIPIPLRAPDPPARLDVQGVLHRIYDAARYQTYIYQGSPVPPLGPDDAAWAVPFVANGKPAG